MAKKNPKISVVMSVYNGEMWLKEAVESILGQTYRDFEFLIVDDGSSDSSLEIINEYKDPRIRVFRHKNSKGLTVSLVEAIKKAKGEFIARMDADDISEPNRFDSQFKFLKKNEGVSVVSSWIKIINSKGFILERVKPANNDAELINILEQTNRIAHGSAMFRKRTYEKVGGYRKLFKYAQDYDLWLRMLEISNIKIIPEFLFQWRIHNSAISANKRAEQLKYADLAKYCYRIRSQGEKDLVQKNDLKTIEEVLKVRKVDLVQSYIERAWGLFFYNEYKSAYRSAKKAWKLEKKLDGMVVLVVSAGFMLMPGSLSGLLKRFYRSLK